MRWFGIAGNGAPLTDNTVASLPLRESAGYAIILPVAFASGLISTEEATRMSLLYNQSAGDLIALLLQPLRQGFVRNLLLEHVDHLDRLRTTEERQSIFITV